MRVKVSQHTFSWCGAFEAVSQELTPSQYFESCSGPLSTNQETARAKNAQQLPHTSARHSQADPPQLFCCLISRFLHRRYCSIGCPLRQIGSKAKLTVLVQRPAHPRGSDHCVHAENLKTATFLKVDCPFSSLFARSSPLPSYIIQEGTNSQATRLS